MLACPITPEEIGAQLSLRGTQGSSANWNSLPLVSGFHVTNDLRGSCSSLLDRCYTTDNSRAHPNVDSNSPSS